MAIIDQEIRRLFFTLITACLVLVFFIWIAANSQAFFSFTNRAYNLITGQKSYDEVYPFNLDKKKTYTVNISTNQGDMAFLLYKDNAPNTVNNYVNLVKNDFYKQILNPIKTDKYIITGNTKKDVNYTISEEINAKSLGLDTITVGQYYDALKDVYDSSLLDQNLSKSLQQFYESVGYKYTTDIVSKPISKGSLVMYSQLPGNFKNQFVISTTGALPSFEGRMTNFGEITSGQDVLDKINNTPIEQFAITSITISEK